RSAGRPPTPPRSSSRGRSTTGPRWTCGAWGSSFTRSSAGHCPSTGRTSRCDVYMHVCVVCLVCVVCVWCVCVVCVCICMCVWCVWGVWCATGICIVVCVVWVCVCVCVCVCGLVGVCGVRRVYSCVCGVSGVCVCVCGVFVYACVCVKSEA